MDDRSLRSDRAMARTWSLRSDRAEHVFGRCVAILFELLSDDSRFLRKAFRKEETISKKCLSRKETRKTLISQRSQISANTTRQTIRTRNENSNEIRNRKREQDSSYSESAFERLQQELGRYVARARSLRSDRVSTRARSLRSDQGEWTFGRYVANEPWLKLGRYVATERSTCSVAA
ncbi:hypothetical protein DY000_02015865 [Brassica cretica]|uniref:Uncharacterized protein n=1 Tax=Brassica cretica TaxID=69181 RepID=A0ABQ7D878_BRACR|nr:hypothetical protein DY000_02015865 [Brassica cretica]